MVSCFDAMEVYCNSGINDHAYHSWIFSVQTVQSTAKITPTHTSSENTPLLARQDSQDRRSESPI